MKVKIKGNIRDILSFMINIKKRKSIFKKASSLPMPPGKLNNLSRNLHPDVQELVIESIKDEGCGVYTYRFRGKERGPAYFIPGQYISIGFRIGESTLHRAFSISSLPRKALNSGYYEITVKTGASGGFTDGYIRDNWKIGVSVKSSGPVGTFTYQGLRDSEVLVCIAGGSGITPFKPMITTLLDKNPGMRILLFHGAKVEDELIFNSFWNTLEAENSGKFKYHVVCSEPGEGWRGLSGFITSVMIEEELKNSFGIDIMEECSYFICGPSGLHDFMDKEFSELKIPGKRVRREEYAVNNRNEGSGKAVFHDLTVRQGAGELLIKADSSETVLVALERAGLNPPSLCRSGECGWCRSRLVSGKISTPVRETGLRSTDGKFGYFHPCCVFPRGELIIEVPGNPVKI